ncbi:hypothetical protein FDO65_18445 [Nakamurella flava]|uniref:Uncharacterized protein n=1 Tax=Nakamurella flava TaxID=2576308 RepID=A0A4U6QA83_9ACTN|nr:hypothetical protein [Nakamurella flava]TKV56826.1 hypothetical protein FDO65_18445 [Nakamurella flava]
MSGASAWQVPADSTPERTTVALARWQRRRIARALAGTPAAMIEPRHSLRAAMLCGIVLTAVLLAASLAIGRVQ